MIVCLNLMEIKNIALLFQKPFSANSILDTCYIQAQEKQGYGTNSMSHEN